MRLRAMMLAARFGAPYGYVNALPEPPARVAAAGMLGEHVDAIESRGRFHAAILAHRSRSRQYDP
jgi:hypothetical protein